MPYATILLHLNDVRRAERVLQAAVPTAREMGAHLIGASVLPPVVVIPPMDGMGTSVTIDDHRVAYGADMAKLKAMFIQLTSAQPLQAEWSEADAGYGSVADVIIERGRCADLIIASQGDVQWDSAWLLEDPVRLAIESGRPVLLVPNAGRNTLPPKRVTVAWNGRREAARAVFDALPFLKIAEDVNVVWIDPESDQLRAGDLPASDICTTLARHGVKCQTSQATAPGGNVGQELLHQANAFGSDLLVMGCYGHSRLREFILGGASKYVLEHMQLPVLLSH